MGLARLAESPTLAKAAQGWAEAMAGGLGLQHGDMAARLWAVLGPVPVGECIGEGYDSPQAAVDGWIGSPPHRAIMVGRFDRCGVGVARDGNGTAWWCLDAASGSD